MKKFLPMMLLGAALFAADAPRPSLVVTAPVAKGVINPLQTYVGTLNYDLKSDLAAEQEGSVRTLYFMEGEPVKEGDLLIELDHEILDASLRAKKAQLEAQLAELAAAERDLERSRALFERKSISESAYDEVFYRVKQLKALSDATRSEIDAMEIQVRKHRITAPFEGIVTARSVQPGEWVGKGDVVATIVAPKSLEAHVSLPASLLATLEANRELQATVLGAEIETKVKSLIPVADAATRTFRAELSVPARKEFIEGMRIDVRVPTLKQAEAMLVPRDAVIRRFGQTVVFASVEGKAVMIPVQVVGYKTDMAAITAQGLNEGSRVVIKGNERIFPNMPLIEQKGE